jgi:hypothetical protein
MTSELVEMLLTDLPDEVHEIVSASVQQHPRAVDAANAAERLVRQLPTFEAFAGILVKHAVEALVHRKRHRNNVKMRIDTGVYVGISPKVLPGNAGVKRVYDLYLYSIDGTKLGEMTKDRLEYQSARSYAVARGHRFNGDLCTKLIPMLREGKTVQESVSKKQLKEVFESCGWKESE